MRSSVLLTFFFIGCSFIYGAILGSNADCDMDYIPGEIDLMTSVLFCRRFLHKILNPPFDLLMIPQNLDAITKFNNRLEPVNQEYEANVLGRLKQLAEVNVKASTLELESKWYEALIAGLEEALKTDLRSSSEALSQIAMFLEVLVRKNREYKDLLRSLRETRRQEQKSVVKIVYDHYFVLTQFVSDLIEDSTLKG